MSNVSTTDAETLDGQDGSYYAADADTFSGDYSDLTGKPSLFSGDYSDLANVSVTTGDLAFDPATQSELNASTFSGDYADLSGKPSATQNTEITTGYDTSLTKNLGAATGSSGTGDDTVYSTNTYTDWSPQMIDGLRIENIEMRCDNGDPGPADEAEAAVWVKIPNVGWTELARWTETNYPAREEWLTKVTDVDVNFQPAIVEEVRIESTGISRSDDFTWFDARGDVTPHFVTLPNHNHTL